MKRNDKLFRDLRKANQSPVLAWGQESAPDPENQRKRLDEILLQNEVLQKINAEKDKFLALIAHDLRNPFSAIVGFSELLIEEVKLNDYDAICNYADLILDSSKRAMNLLMNLLEWSQSQTGRLNFNPEYFELIGLINEVALLYFPSAAKKAITINAIKHYNVLIYADKSMISTVLRNLISNAVKFTQQGGEITISVVNKQNHLTFSVSDTGVGISKSVIDKLFRNDHNFSTSGTLNEKGTGLGLILCKEFIEKHGGKIWAESEEGKGSTFYFSL